MFEFEVMGLPGLKNRFRNSHRAIDEGIKMYLAHLAGHGGVSIETDLQNRILTEVYLRDSPMEYERTQSLMNATRIKLEDNTIHLYMDDEYLHNQPHYRRVSLQTGSEPASRKQMSYAQQAELDTTFRNVIGSYQTREGSEYMKQAASDIIESIRSGRRPVHIIWTPLRKLWLG